MRKLFSGLVILSVLVMSVPAHAEETVTAFSDVPQTNPVFQAVMYLRVQGMLKGYSDNTFRPNQPVDRASALKMILAGRVTDEQVAGLQNPGFNDIAGGAWYAGYVAKAVELGIIDPPSKGPAFNGSRPVVLAEFLKMLLLAQGMDPHSYSEIALPLSSDVSDVNTWFFPYMRVSFASSLLQVDTQGMLHPEKKLTRGDVALSVYHLLMYKTNRRTQALLSMAETELSGNLLSNLNAQGLPFAKMARARALLAVRGALTSRPDSVVVKGAVKVTEGFGALVDAYEFGVSGHPDDVIASTGKAYHLATQAKEFSPSLNEIATNMQAIAHNMAEEARAVKAKAN